jgi:NitT/TauT family transport system substrate-binding protein
VVTWNPLVSEILAMPGSHKVFDSSQIPGEIIDLMVVNTETLKDNPALGKALVGAWYEIMGSCPRTTRPARPPAPPWARPPAPTSPATTPSSPPPRCSTRPGCGGLRHQPGAAETMEHVAQFSFDHGLLGEGAPDAGFIGIAFPDGKVLGNAGNVKLRFDAEYMGRWRRRQALSHWGPLGTHCQRLRPCA